MRGEKKSDLKLIKVAFNIEAIWKLSLKLLLHLRKVS